MSQGTNPYGDGQASSRIVSTLIGLLNVGPSTPVVSPDGHPIKGTNHKAVAMQS